MARTHGKDADFSFDSVALEDELSSATLNFTAEEIDFEPDGSTGYNGFAIVTSYSISSTVGGPITYSASFRHTGGSAANDANAPTRA